MSRLVSTACAKAGLLMGYKVASETGDRAAGGTVLAACGAAAFTVWQRDAGTARAVALTGTYLAAFGASHPLAKKIGAWPAVFAVTGVTALASMIFGGRKK
ncbi:hypothetical protein [Zhihengliuella flava]|uniref:Uncharacterized membrane protein YebE (DUF533 family) n=1 Tax=Zhihengliuella flava TaxID=1285193 RepID=A0A931D7V5_9MICC|nr:hypothetical protein [Zhihengliuella flava]MBG6085285.1 uncharacterized membrane protein YebE (DUF533 family) [Zhihengliuella flava]